MFASSHLASFVLLVLSLGLLTCTAPMPIMLGQKLGKFHMLAVLGYQEGAGNVKILLGVITDLKAKVIACADTIVDIKVDVLVEAQAGTNALIAHIQLCKTTLASLKNLDNDVKLKASTAAHVLLIIKAILKICALLTAKIGIPVFLELFARLNLCLKVLLWSLDVCMNGFLVTIGKLLVEVNLKALVKSKLVICYYLFVLVCVVVGIVAVVNAGL
ncbi:hypothetical protein B0J17DRAFT_721759 [Rhizoctonia solani]|nr:hypothetical protein B0J17DRAFT_721759 [Rhizoctonia solani]